MSFMSAYLLHFLKPGHIFLFAINKPEAFLDVIFVMREVYTSFISSGIFFFLWPPPPV